MKDLIPGGLGDKTKNKDFDQKELQKGIKVECEHTENSSLAAEIARDHLTEDPKYYDKLEKMEGKKAVSVKISELEERLKSAVLKKHVNPSTGKEEWALMSTSSPGKVLEYFGSEKPSDERVEKSEKRVQWFKNQG